MASNLNLAGNWAADCRAIYAKSVVLPWGEERPIIGLFASKKEIARISIGELLKELSEKDQSFSDASLKEILFQRHGLKASRRSINIYRREVQGGK